MDRRYNQLVYAIQSSPFDGCCYLDVIKYLRTVVMDNHLRDDVHVVDDNDNSNGNGNGKGHKEHIGRLLEYRQTYSSMFLPNKSFWIEWLEDESSLQLSSMTNEDLHQLYQKAIHNYPHFEICLKYIDTFYMRYTDISSSSGGSGGGVSEDELRKVFELSVTHCGFDMVSGSAIWKKYQDFERELLDDFCEQLHQSMKNDDVDNAHVDSQYEHKRRKERFINSYSRQLSLPLIGNEETLKDFESELSVYCVESDVHLIQPESLQRKVKQAMKDRGGRQDYEITYHSDQFQAYSHQDKLSFWNRYIEFEMKQLQYSRVQRLYERAVLDTYEVNSYNVDCTNSNNSINISISSNHRQDHHHNINSIHHHHQQYQSLWLDYIAFALCNLKNSSLVNDITRRALRIYRDSIYLWKLLLYCMESSIKMNNNSNDDVPVEEEGGGGGEDSLLAELQIILSSTSFNNLEEYYDLYLTYCNFCRRKLQFVWNGINNNNNNNNSNNNQQHQQQLSQHSHDMSTEDKSLKNATTGRVHNSSEYDLSQLQASINQLQASFTLMTSFLTSYCLNGWVVLWWKWCLYQSHLDTSLLLDTSKYILLLQCQHGKNNNYDDDQSMDVTATGNNTIGGSSILEFSSNKLNKIPSNKKNHKNKTTIITGSQQKIVKTDIWEVALKHFPHSSFLYLEYISFLRRHRDYEQCRRVFKKIININLDNSSHEEICKNWIDFEQEYGTLSDVQSALIRTFSIMKPNMITSPTVYNTTTSDGSQETESIESIGSDGDNNSSSSSRYMSSRTKRKLDDANELYNNENNHHHHQQQQQQQNVITRPNTSSSHDSIESSSSDHKKVGKRVKFAEQDVIATFDRKSGIVVQSPVKPIIVKHVTSRITLPMISTNDVKYDSLTNNDKHNNSSSAKHGSRSNATESDKTTDSSSNSSSSDVINDDNTSGAIVVDALTAIDGDSGVSNLNKNSSSLQHSSSNNSSSSSSSSSRKKIQVRNFSFTSPFDSLLPFILDKCSTILPYLTSTDVCMILSKAGKSRGIVEIDCPVDCTSSQLLQLQECFHDYQFNDRRLVAEIIYPTKDNVIIDKAQSSSMGSSSVPHLTTVFVKGFSATVTEDDLKQHFDPCGHIIAVKVSVDKKTGVSKVLIDCL